MYLFVFYHSNYRKNPKQTQQKNSCHCVDRTKDAPSYHSAPWELLPAEGRPARDDDAEINQHGANKLSPRGQDGKRRAAVLTSQVRTVELLGLCTSLTGSGPNPAQPSPSAHGNSRTQLGGVEPQSTQTGPWQTDREEQVHQETALSPGVWPGPIPA